MDDFILEIPNSLSKNVCDKIIKQFEEDDTKLQGCFGKGYVNKKTKTSIDLFLSAFSDWNHIDNLLSKALSIGVDKYRKYIRETKSDTEPESWSVDMRYLYDSGYQIQRTDTNGFYKWHHDFLLGDKECRILTFIWYLNTLEPEQEGNTEFIGGKKVRPETGKLLLFPATWTGLHRGGVLKSGKKYLITGWLFKNLD